MTFEDGNDVANLKSNGIYSSLKTRILDGGLGPGERLRLSDVARLYGTSEIPVREALRMLERDGLVKMTPYHGARVVEVNAETLQESYFVRGHLESLATSLTASLITDDQLIELKGLVREMDIAAVDHAPARYAELNRAFHGKIIEFCGNVVLRDVLIGLEISQAAFQTVFRLRPDRLMSSSTEHVAILDALRARDPALAGRLALEHKLEAARSLSAAVTHAEATPSD